MPETLLKKPTGFDGFGPSILARQMRGRLRGAQIPSERLAARKMLRENCPLAPGVYGWLNSNRQLTYVGKSKSLRKRLLSYFAKNPAEKKVERIRQNSQFIVWEPISHELLALIREQELIHRWRPEFNSMGQPTRMQPAFLCIGGSPAPNARLERRLTGNFSHAFGPISGTKRLRDAIVSLNQAFQLRDCPDKTKFEFKNQQFLFDNPASAKCIRHELATCPAPCAGMCSASSYTQLVDFALKFLNGDSQPTLQKIESKMQDAAKREAFESAAIFRDSLDQLSWLDRRLHSLRLADMHLNGVLRIEARRNRTAWMILRGGRIVETLLEPEKPDRAEIVKNQLQSINRSTPELPTNLLEMSLQLIIISWFRKSPAIKKQVISFDQAISHCQQRATDVSAAA